MEDEELIALALWLKDQHKIALDMAKASIQPEQGLYFARAGAFEDVMKHIERP